LIGPGLVLRLNGGADLGVDLDGPFTFSTKLAQGAAYRVEVQAQPQSQMCSVSNGASGTISSSPVTDVRVQCVTVPATVSYAVGGQVTGLSGEGLLLTLNGNIAVAPTGNGAFTFPTSLADGTAYQVEISSQPQSQICGITAGSQGKVSSASINEVAVSCAASPTSETPTYSVGGMVTGLTETGLLLQLNGANALAVQANGSFNFSGGLAAGSSYQVTVKAQPSGELCSVSNGTGTLGSADVSNVSIACAAPPVPPPSTFQVKGAVTGLHAAGLVLEMGATQIAVGAASTTFVFPDALNQGAAYQVLVAANPTGQICTPSSNAGIIGTADVSDVLVTCIDAAPPPPSSGLQLDKTSLVFNAEQGQTTAAQTINGSVVGATDAVYVYITYTNNAIDYATFQKLTPTSGSLSIKPVDSGFRDPGTYDDTVTVKACFDSACTRPVDGSPKVVNVSYTVSPNNPTPVLRLSARGVALAMVGSSSHLTRSVKVVDTSGAASSWSATSDASWLATTASGQSGGNLTLSAHPDGLADGYYEATITVTSSSAAIAQAETIRVGLYKSSVAGVGNLASPLVPAFDCNCTVRFVADPVHPWFYSFVAASNTIAVQHAYTGQRLATITLPAAQLTSIAASDDGHRLYAFDAASGEVVVVNLDTLSIDHTYGFPQLGWPIGPSSVVLAYSRVEDQPVLILNSADSNGRTVMPVVRADTGEIVGSLYGYSNYMAPHFARSGDGTVVYLADPGLSGYLSLFRMELRANSEGNIYGKLTAQTPAVPLAALEDFSANEDGSVVIAQYGTEGAVRQAVFDGNQLTWVSSLAAFVEDGRTSTSASPADTKFDRWNRAFVRDAGFDVRLYAADGTLQQQWLDLWSPAIAHDSAAGTMEISADGLRLVGSTYLMDLPQ
jgi:hypothetical protein